MNNICSSCGQGTLSPRMTSSPFMIIKEVVTNNELESGTVFVQKGKNQNGYEENTSSYYLNRELGMQGLQLSSFSQSCLFMHHIHKGGRTKEGKEVEQGCIDYSIGELIKIAQNKKIIFMMGAKTINLFTGYNASDVYGLVCKSELLPEVPVIIPSTNSDKIMKMPIGEMRNSIAVLAEQIKIYKQYQGD